MGEITLVGRRPNHPEGAWIALLKKRGFKQGKNVPTGVRWNRRSLKRAALGTGDFYNNCVWGPFKCSDGKRHPFEMDSAFPELDADAITEITKLLSLLDKERGTPFKLTKPKLDVEIDGIVYHSGAGKERDQMRDAALEEADWQVFRITTDQLYRVYVPLLSERVVKTDATWRKRKAKISDE